MKKSIFLIILAAVGAVVFYGVRYMKTPVTAETAVMVKYEEVVTGPAFIVRSETVHTAPSNGTFYAYAVDGNRVGKNRRIASVYEGTVNTDMLQELNNIDKKIEIAEVQSSTKQIETSDSASEESKIAERRNDIIDAVYDENIESIAEYKDEIKNIRNGNAGSENENELEQLKEKRESLESRIGKARVDIYSNNSGVFVAAVDGYEDKLIPSEIGNLTVADFNALNVPEKAISKTMVSIGDTVCKVVSNDVWYAAVKVKADTLSKDYGVGSNVTVRFGSIPSSEVNATICALSDEQDGEILVCIKCDEYLDGIFSERYCEAEIVLKSYQGFKVPIYAIRVEGEQKGVEVEKGLETVFKPCEIVYTNEDEEFVIINSVEGASKKLEVSDRIVIGEK